MAITPEERADLVKDIAKEISANVSGPLASVVEKLEKLEANHQKLASDLTANSRAELEEKRKAVAAVHGEIVANGATPEMLEVLHKNIGTAAPIVNGKAADGDKQDFSQAVE